MRSSPLLAKYTSLPGCCRGTDGHCVATSSNQSANNPLITENIKEMKIAMGLSQIMNLPNLLWNFQSPPMAFTSGSLISWRWFNCNQEWNAGHVIQRWGFQLSCISFFFIIMRNLVHMATDDYKLQQQQQRGENTCSCCNFCCDLWLNRWG